MKLGSKYQQVIHVLSFRGFLLLLLSLLLVLPSSVEGKKKTKRKPSKNQLECLRKQKERDIKDIKLKLSLIKNKQHKNKEKVRLLDRQIVNRKQMIDNYQNELKIIEGEVKTTDKKVGELSGYLDTLKTSYAGLLKSLYQLKLLHSDDLALVNIKAYRDDDLKIILNKYYIKALEEQATEIKITQNRLNDKMLSLKVAQANKESIVHHVNHEKRNLEEEHTERTRLAITLDEQKDDLKKTLKKRQQEARELESAISRAIAKEFSANKSKKKKGSNKKSNKDADNEGTAITLSPEEKKLSDNFEGNKSSLPWPLEKGYIHEHYGIHEHQNYKGVYINNNGVRFQTVPGSIVRSVFNGEVRYVLPLPNGMKFVLIKHGNYFTVYSNLQVTFVKAGQNIKAKQTIGAVGSADNKNGELDFQIWRGCCKKLNPEDWIISR